MHSNVLSLMSEHLLKRIKPFRIVYLKSRLQDFRLSEGKHQNNKGGSIKKVVVDTLKITQFCLCTILNDCFGRLPAEMCYFNKI